MRSIESVQVVQYITVIMIMLLAVTVHEVSHGFTAFRLGDDTAYYAGRLTLNPIAHIDLFGTILMPILLYIGSQGAFTFGAAKPVPVNPQRFRRDITMRSGMSLVAAAGPLSNILLAVLFAAAYRACAVTANPYAVAMAKICEQSVVINLYLAFFNFIPVPPLDGSKVILPLLSPNSANALLRLETYGFVILLFLVFFTPLGRIIGNLTIVVAAALMGLR